MLFRVVATLATTALALANPLITRQTTNTNPQIGDVLNKLSILNREIFFNIVTMQANNTATDGTIGVQVQNLITGFNGATSDLLAIPVSAGSTTDLPRDIDLSRVLGESLQITATGFSGLQAQQSVPNFSAMIAQLDPAVAATINALNTTLPGATGFVHILMLDVSQFLRDEGAWPETIAALGF
uniref:Laccase small subunit n=1 Tax=Leucoagaricus gongylophorus TaxID=79220 RepID=U6NJA2_LEUGO|nr:laccase small subunit precursor [Leucoagaricus gongylophorus]